MSDRHQTQPAVRLLSLTVPVSVVALVAAATVLVVLAISGRFVVRGEEQPSATDEDPGAWGSDHVGQSFPEYITGDECLFCHRRKIGPSWQQNVHQLTIRPAQSGDSALAALKAVDEDAAGQTQLVLGSQRLTRYLKRSQAYGQLDLLSVLYRPQHGTAAGGEAAGGKPAGGGRIHGTQPAAWDAETFAGRCAGCHTTAVDADTGAFSAISLDCFTCHGDVSLTHTDDPGQVFLSVENRDPRAVISTCSQCHLRGGKSRSTGRPYANTFVPGDNLFRDFVVDLSDETIQSLPATEQHIYQNARDVVAQGITTTTCLSCHEVHAQSTERHVQLEWSGLCSSCHDPNSADHELRKSVLSANQLANHNGVCDY